MVVGVSQEWENPLVEFFTSPFLYTGTPWKFERISEQYNEFVMQRKWKEEILPLLGQLTVAKIAEQLAVPAVEPNELIDSGSLMRIKARRQVNSLDIFLKSGERLGKHDDVIMPGWLRKKYLKGEVVDLSFVSTDTSIRELYRSVSTDGSVTKTTKWIPRRNFYYKRRRNGGDIEADATELNKYWISQYSLYGWANEVIRVADSGLAFVQASLQKERAPIFREAVGNSTSAVRMTGQPLATEVGRDAYRKLIGNGGLKNLDNRAGGVMVEDLRMVAAQMGFSAEILTACSEDEGGLNQCPVANGKRCIAKFESLMEHLEGAPYALWKAMFYTIATSEDVDKLFAEMEPIIDMYPPGLNKLLQV